MIFLAELVGKPESYIEHLKDAASGIPIAFLVLWFCGRLAKRGADCYLRDFKEGRRNDVIIWMHDKPRRFWKP